MTIVEPRIYLGELADLLAKQTGASITVSDARFPMSGIETCCLVKDKPAHRVMGALTDLYGDPDCRWQWVVTETATGKAYKLNAPRPPNEVVAVRLERIRRQWEADAWEQYRVARLPRAERLAAAARRPDLFGRLDRAESWTGYLAAGELTPDEFASALRGQNVVLPPSRISDGIRRLVASQFEAEQGRQLSAERPIRTLLRPRGGANLAPVLSVDPGDGGYRSVLDGWWQGQWLERNAPEWHGPLDPETGAALMRLDKLGPNGAGPLGMTRGQRQAWLEAASEIEKSSIMADVFEPGRSLMQGVVRGASQKDTIVRLCLGTASWRRSGEVWLIRNNSRWTDPRDYLVPLGTIRALRAAAQKQDGQLNLKELARIAALEPPQWLALLDEFPDAEPERMNRWVPIFRFWAALDEGRRSRLLSPEGLSLASAEVAASSKLFPKAVVPTWPGGTQLAPQWKRAVVRLTPAKADAAAALTWDVTLQGASVANERFVLEKHRPLEAVREPPKPRKAN